MTPADLARLTRSLLLALLLAGCATRTTSDDAGRCWTNSDSCLIRARALAEGAPRLVTYAELARVCRGEAP